MKRDIHLIPISRQHHQMLMLAQLLKKNAPPYKGLPSDLAGKAHYALLKFKTLIKPHFQNEEDNLIAKLRNYDPDVEQLCQEILEEHQNLEESFEQIRQHHLSEDILDTLGKQLELHIRKEERVFFQMIQEKLKPEEMEKIGQNLI